MHVASVDGTVIRSHLRRLRQTAEAFEPEAGKLARWGLLLARTLVGGGRLLVAGNGGSAAQAQHLAAEFVGKLRADRVPLSAIALTADTCGMTAIANDYGYGHVFARQVRAHGTPGDVLLLISTSGRSPNLLEAADTGRAIGMRTWAFTGDLPNPLAQRCTETVAVPSGDTQIVQELQLAAAHLLCEYVDATLARAHEAPPTPQVELRLVTGAPR
ncbi:SIS domain-containing protein [Catellatospora sp. NPDC049609]|uniref:D-sedoheptulose-7-phosphate isomerase n=1 Tax=Catellatospora sp. NPDC049609 TaxID=3155505 RepID=UPI0034156F23